MTVRLKMLPQFRQIAFLGLWLLGSLFASPEGAGAVEGMPLAEPSTALEENAAIGERFALNSRFAVRMSRPGQDSQSLSGRLQWQHDPVGAVDLIDFLSPFGHTLARLQRSALQADLSLANGRHFSAPSLSALAEEGLGVALPFERIPAWLFGQAASHAQIERDALGRPITLQEDIWVVHFQYRDHPTLPSVLNIDSREGFSLKLLADQWYTGAAARTPPFPDSSSALP